MPPKAQSPINGIDESTLLLYACIKYKTGDRISFDDVSALFNITANAAGVRYYRLRQRLDQAISDRGDEQLGKGEPGEGSEAGAKGAKRKKGGNKVGEKDRDVGGSEGSEDRFGASVVSKKRKRGGVKAAKEAETVSAVDEAEEDGYEEGIGGKKVKVEMV